MAKTPGNVIVIGAGMAGLAAAHRLKRRGFRVTVLEARNRLGGRTWTDNTLGIPVDMGAAWIEGTRNNPITKLAKDAGVTLAPTDWDNPLIYDADGSPLSKRNLKKLSSAYEELEETLEKEGDTLNSDTAISAWIEDYLEGEDLSKLEQRGFDWITSSLLVMESGAEPRQLSAKHWGDDEEYPGDDAIIREGYQKLVKRLAKKLDIQLKQKVKAITYGKSGVSVETQRSTWTADAVLITVPLGVLKAQKITFSPPLPDRKRRAIKRLDMGLLNKIALTFPKAFWPEEPDIFGYISKTHGEFPEIVNGLKVWNKPVLIGYVGGDFARKLEKKSKPESVAMMMKVLRRIAGHNIPEPTGAILSQWASDPWALGSYAYIPPGASPKDYRALAKPVADRLFFAGEATTDTYPGTVHGAYLTGIREAKRIEEVL